MRSVSECKKDLQSKLDAAGQELRTKTAKLLNEVIGMSEEEAGELSRGVLNAVLDRHTPGIEAVFTELAEHDSPEAVKAICQALSDKVVARYRHLAMEALSRMCDPSAGKALSKRASAWLAS